MGDQFLALAEGDDPVADRHRHFGLVVDDREAVRRALTEAGIDEEPSRGLRFRDPWGNLVEVVQYSEVQFTKAPPVLGGMELDGLGKSDSAQQELREKGLAPESRSSSFAACSSVGSMIGQDCSIAFGLPGRFTISVRPRTPDTPRVRWPSGVCCRASIRIASA